MRQIYPARNGTTAGRDGPVDLAAVYAYPPVRRVWRVGPAEPVGRSGPVEPSGAIPVPRAWVRANMVASADGATALKGESGGLSSAVDRRLFMTLRALADVILVGGRTVRVERYGPSRPRDDWTPLRAGRPPSPPIAIVTSKLGLDLSSPLFTEAPRHARTIVLTTEAASPDRRAQAARHAEVLITGRERVDLAAAITTLAGRGLARVLTEGGPGLLGQLAMADLLDELCLTVSPLLAGGAAGRVMVGASLPAPWRLRLAHVLEDDGSLFCRYLRDTVSDAPGRRRAGEEASQDSTTESDKDASA